MVDINKGCIFAIELKTKKIKILLLQKFRLFIIKINKIIKILSGCGMQSDTKQKRGEALLLGEFMTPEAQPIAFGVGG